MTPELKYRFFAAFGLLLLLATKSAAQQHKYSDYTDSDKEIILNEDFNSFENGWQKGNKVEISNSNLTLRGMTTSFSNIPKTFIPINIDQNKDFEIEWSLLSKKVPKGLISPLIAIDNLIIVIADYKKETNLIVAKSVVDIFSNTNQAIDALVDLAVVQVQLKEEVFNKYTIRKVNNNFIFFVNEKFVTIVNSFPLAQPRVLFRGSSVVYSVDFLRVSYLQPQFTEPIRTNRKSDGLEIKSIKEGGRYFSLIVGVSDYNESKLNLEHPTNDAQKLKNILITRYTFSDSTIFFVQNPTRQKLLSELFKLRKIVGPNDNLLIFYAGHGYWDEDAKQGYWWPRDASTDDPSNWLSNSDLREQIRSIKSGHTLLISDACFSGGIFKTRSGSSIMNAPKDIQVLYKMPSRRAITSGTMTTVPDKSVFLEYLCKRLTENQNKFLSSQSLFDSFRAAVINNSNTVPQDGVIAETGDEGGDFIFILKDKK